jgi:DNA N-6-adenine-methyltransferase (Dam)
MAMGSHQSAAMKSDSWLTPPQIIEALGDFDLDPCCPRDMPWRTAAAQLTLSEDGLIWPWAGRVWLNPPYSTAAVLWMRKMAEHGNGIALTFARTETAWFFETIWRAANAVLFLEGRIHFHHPDGKRAKANAGAPSCLAAYGKNNTEALRHSGIAGQLVLL